MKDFRTLLKSDGICLIRIPNIDSAMFKLFKENWFALDIPRHVFHYTPDTFSKLVEQHGLKVKKVDFNSPNTGFFTSLDYASKEGTAPNIFKPVKKNSFWKNIWRPAGWVIDRLHKGDIVEYTLFKPR